MEVIFIKSNKFLNLKNLAIICLLISLVFNIIIYKDYKYQKHFFNRYRDIIESHSINSIDDAKSDVEALNIVNSPYAKVKRLIMASREVMNTSKHIGDYSIYLDYKDKDRGYGGNYRAYKFFNQYRLVLENWAAAIQFKDVENQPSDEDIKNMIKDLDNIKNALIEQPEDLTMDKLNNIIKRLIEETKTEDVKEFLREANIFLGK
ncbi:hypothetical protein [Dethiothermospora halolimnae]|uniref:hypothetical protein n=1 Tax=Dethiothermospora halolimnae TaxID=3114390 RepID=UPI003CCB8F57